MQMSIDSKKKPLLPFIIGVIVSVAACGNSSVSQGDAGLDLPGSQSDSNLEPSLDTHLAAGDRQALNRDTWPPLKSDQSSAKGDVWSPLKGDTSPSKGDSQTSASKAQINLTFGGCHPDFSGKVMVIHSNGILGVSAIQSTTVGGSFQFDLKGQTGNLQISTKNRMQTGVVINLVVSNTTFTNITADQDYFLGNKPDPIKGTLIVKQFQPAAGLSDLTFQGVTLENVGSTGSHCTINGTLKTTGLGY